MQLFQGCNVENVLLRHPGVSNIVGSVHIFRLDCGNEDIGMNLLLILSILVPHHYIIVFSQVVFVSPFEHHANLLPWRESGAEVVWVSEDSSGMTDISDLEKKLKVYKLYLCRNHNKCCCCYISSSIVGVVDC